MTLKRIVVLGSSAQVPTRERNHSGYFLLWNKEGLLFDPGEGTQRQFTHFNIKSTQVTKIFISHFHGDHFLGLPGFLQRVALEKPKHRLDLFYPASGQECLEHLLAISFCEKQLNITCHPIGEDGEIFNSVDYSIYARSMNHPVKTYGFRIKEHDSVTMIKEKLVEKDLKGEEIGKLKQNGIITKGLNTVKLSEVSRPKGGQCFCFITDTSLCDNAIRLSEAADILVCESTYASEHEELAKLYGHLTANQAALIAKQAGVKKLILTHFSQRYQSTQPLLEEAVKVFPETLAAKDGDCFGFS